MRNNDKDRFLDALLDNAIKEYGDAEPRVGLENRVLARLQSEFEHGARGRWWWFLASAVATAAVAVAIWVWIPGRDPSSSGRIVEEARVPAPVIAPPAQQLGTVPHAKPRTHGARSAVPGKMKLAAEPKLDFFPSPQPLSEQEAMLQRYVNEHREHAILVARLQTELLKSDRQEFFRQKDNGSGMDSDHQEK